MLTDKYSIPSEEDAVINERLRKTDPLLKQLDEAKAEIEKLKAELYRVTAERSDWIACAECYRNERDTLQRDIDSLRALISGE